MWQFFGFEIDDNKQIINDKQVVCKQCRATIAFSGCTTNMDTHLRRCIKSLSQPKIKEHFVLKTKTTMPATAPLALAISKQMEKTITKHMMPISSVEAFAEVLEIACPEYKCLKRTAMMGHIEKDAIDKRAQILDELKNTPYCTLTIDHWTSIANEGYIGVTVHYVTDDWVLHSVALEVSEVSEAHTAHNIAVMLEEIEVRYKIFKNKFKIMFQTINYLKQL